MRIALIGKGKMGNELINLAQDQIVAVIENFKYNFLEDNLKIDVIIDFSNRENIKYIYEYAKSFSPRDIQALLSATIKNHNDKYGK